MGVFDGELYDLYDEVLLSWRMLLFGLGVFIFIGGNRSLGLIVSGLGVLAFLNVRYSDLGEFIWPGFLLFAGLVLMFGSRGKWRAKPKDIHFKESNYGPTQTEVSNDYFDEFVIFGGREINMSTQNLLGGRSSAIFGGAEVDLRQCQISPEGCTIDLTSIFGGNVLKVPNDWTVLNRVTTIFGGYSDLRIKDASYAPTPSKTIVVTGVCIFGGTEVRNFSKLH
jgi:predicted membrane protein